MSAIEQTIAIQDTYNVIQEYGNQITLIQQTEETRQEDKFGSPKKVVVPSSETLMAFPIRFKPSVKEIKQAGFSEDVDVIIYVSTKEMEDKSITFDILRDRVRINNQQYKISEQSPNGQFGDKFRSHILGLIQE